MPHEVDKTTFPDIWILHLSDLHMEDTPGDATGILDRLNKVRHDWRKETFTDMPDLCVITGDLAQKGSKEEYANLTKVIDVLKKWMATDSAAEYFPIFVVPGNHDQDCKSLKSDTNENVDTDVYKRLSEAPDKEVYLKKEHPCFSGAESSEVAANNVWADHESAWRLGVEPRFRNYNNWLREELPHMEHVNNIVAGCWRCSIIVKNRQLVVVGLNTAVASTGLKENLNNRKHWLSLEQIRMVMDTCPMSETPLIALMHHPFFTLSVSDEAAVSKLKRNASLVLSGHVHGKKIFEWDSEPQNAPNIIARAFEDPNPDPTHGYGIIQLCPDKISLTLRLWNPTYACFATDTKSGPPEGGKLERNIGYIKDLQRNMIPIKQFDFEREEDSSLGSGVGLRSTLTSQDEHDLIDNIKILAMQLGIPELGMLIVQLKKLIEILKSSTIKEQAREVLDYLKRHGHDAYPIIESMVKLLEIAIRTSSNNEDEGGGVQ